MPIEFYEEDGRSGPIVICDHCGKRITEALNGNALWMQHGKSHKGVEVRRIWFTHKACNHAFEASHPTDEYEIRGAIGLDMFVLYLMDNVCLDLKSAKKTAAVLDSIG